MTPDPTAARPLEGLRVLDLAGALGAYSGRLLADLGADVLRVDPPSGGTCSRVAPFLTAPDHEPTSLFDRFVNAGKRSITLDCAAPEAREVLAVLLSRVDVVIESDECWLDDIGWTTATLATDYPHLVRTVVSPFGRDDAYGVAPVDDLLLLAAGGLLHLGGYPDTGPIAPHGHQSRFAVSTFASVATLAALIEREMTGVGGAIDVSAQEAVAQALETSLPEYALTGHVRGPRGDAAREAGTGTYACADGWVSLVAGRLGTAKAWGSLVTWMAESDSPGTAELLADDWSDFTFRQSPDAIDRFEEIFEAFAASRTREELYRDAQARGIALCPVNDMTSLLEDRQLRARGFYVEVDDPATGRTLTYPGLPYRLHGTPLRGPQPAPVTGAANAAVYLGELGMSADELDALLERGVV